MILYTVNNIYYIQKKNAKDEINKNFKREHYVLSFLLCRYKAKIQIMHTLIIN